MKDLDKIPEITEGQSAADVYNILKNGEKSDVYEAKRALEAIQRVYSVSQLKRRLSKHE